MTEQEFDRLGEQIAMNIAAGLMKSAAAGAARFAEKMTQVERDAQQAAADAEADGLVRLAECIEQKREELQQQIAEAKGLKRAALERRLAQLDRVEADMAARLDAEARMVVELMGQEPKAIAEVPEPVRSRTIPLHEATQPRRNGKH